MLTSRLADWFVRSAGWPDYLWLDYYWEVWDMHSLIVLHRSLMQEDQDQRFACHRSLLNSEAVHQRNKDRQELRKFLESRGLDKAARTKRRPILRLVENCGSKLGLIPKF